MSKTKEELLNGIYPGIENLCKYPKLIEEAMQQYADQQTASIVQKTLEYVAENAKILYHDGFTKEDKELNYFQSGADNIKINRVAILNMQSEILKQINDGI